MEVKQDGWEMRYEKDGSPVYVGDEVKDMTITGGRPPHKPSSSGRVYVAKTPHTMTTEYFPSVVGAIWVKE